MKSTAPQNGRVRGEPSVDPQVTHKASGIASQRGCTTAKVLEDWLEENVDREVPVPLPDPDKITFTMHIPRSLFTMEEDAELERIARSKQITVGELIKNYIELGIAKVTGKSVPVLPLKITPLVPPEPRKQIRRQSAFERFEKGLKTSPDSLRVKADAATSGKPVQRVVKELVERRLGDSPH